MKRAILDHLRRAGAAILIGIGLGTMAACSAPVGQPAKVPVGASAWVATPMILSAERAGQMLTLRGITAPAGRVVVRRDAGVAYATGADDQGRFALGIGLPVTDALFVVETQSGQEAAPAPYRLFVTSDPDGPIALLTPGGPSQRLDAGGPLDAIDGDGRALIASGRSAPSQVLPVALGGAAPVAVRAGPDGRWVERLDAGQTLISVGGRRYVAPAWSGSGGPGALSVQPAGSGRLVRWATPGGSVQQSWFPDAG
jgi:hypothetical protein